MAGEMEREVVRERSVDLAALVAVIRGTERGVVLTGAAGIGKTWLAREAVRRAPDVDVAVAWIQADATSCQIPFGAVAPYLPSAAGSGDDVLPMLVVATRALLDLAGDRPLLLVVDDAPLLDDASALVVAQAVATGHARLIATQRDGAVLPDPLARLGLGRHVVGPLDQGSTTWLAERVVGGTIAPSTAERLFRLSGGNPLHLHELVLAGQDGGRWHEGDDGWSLPAEVGAPPRLRELVDARLRGLPPDAIDAVTLLALGEPLGLATLEALSSASAVEALDDAGLVDVVVDGRRTQLRLAHPIYTEVLRARVSVLRRRRLSGRLADALRVHGGRRRDDTMRIATWYLDAGGDVPADVLLPAARHARQAGDTALAERLLRASMAQGPTFDAGHLLADTIFRDGRSAEVVDVLDVVDALDLTAAERSTTRSTRAADRFWNVGDLAGAEALLDEAYALAPDDAGRTAVVAFRASVLAMSRRLAEALALAEPCLDGPMGKASLDAALAVGFAARAMGRGEHALAVMERVLGAYASMGEDVAVMTEQVLGSVRTLALVDLGRLDDAEASAAATLEAARVTGEHAALGFAEMCLGGSLVRRGRFRSAAAHHRAAARHIETMNRPGMMRWAVGGQWLALASCGDVEGARRLRDEVEALGPHPATLFDGAFGRADAATAAAEGRVDAAADRLVAAAQEARVAGDAVNELDCLHDLVLIGRPERGLARLRALAPAVDGEWAPVFLAHAEAAAAGAADALGAVATRLEALGATAAAIAAARAAADAHARAGDQRAAARWVTRARVLVGTGEDAGGPVATGLGGADPLTRREREIAELASEGLTSKVIAERLVVSARTVESHLLRIYAKLGVRSRSELAELLAQDA